MKNITTQTQQQMDWIEDDLKEFFLLKERLIRSGDKIEKIFTFFENEESLLLLRTLNQLPMPFWIKNSSGGMIFFNKHYEMQFGVSLYEYEKKTKENFYYEMTKNYFNNSDQFCYEKKTIFESGEPIVNFKTKELDFCHCLKWPVIKNDYVIAIAGIILEPRKIFVENYEKTNDE